MREFINKCRFKYLTALAGFSNAIIKAITKKNLGSKGYIWLILPVHGPSIKKLGQELK